MLPIIGGLISVIGNVFGGVFRTKEAGINAISAGAQSAIDLIKSVDSSEADRDTAIAQVIAADSSSESWLTRTWRPIIACTLWLMVFAIILGWHPHFLDSPLTPTMDWVFRIAEGCLFGYMPLRSVDKWITEFTRSKMFAQIIDSLTKKAK